MENTWLAYAKRLNAIAMTGLSYSINDFDKERYQEIASISHQMMSLIGQIPIERIAALMASQPNGYVTPKIDVRGAVFKDNMLLLVKEKSDGRWTLPGGFADVGLSPAENIEKEIKEEAGINTIASKLYSVRHKAKGSYSADLFDFYKLFFICETTDETPPSPGMETADAQYFSIENLPELSVARVTKNDLLAAWKYRQNTSQAAYFE